MVIYHRYIKQKDKTYKVISNMGEFKDLTGMVFDMLTIIRQADDYISPSGRCYRTWLCQCECGSEPKIIKEYSLMDKRWPTTNCGCLKGTSNKKYNKYDLTGEYGIGWTNKGEMFILILKTMIKLKIIAGILITGISKQEILKVKIQIKKLECIDL